MKVLIADFDLYRTVGGGQTVYRSLIERNPNIDFWYLTRHEPPHASRPTNAHPLRLQHGYTHLDWPQGCDALPSQRAISDLVLANNIALTVQGREFHIVDVPDYFNAALFLRPAFLYHHVRFERIALSLHGRISATSQYAWCTADRDNSDLAELEELQYRTVDLRYGMSRDYLDDYADRTKIDAHYLHPLHVLDLCAPKPVPAGTGPPDINFIGRTERCKGPDLFINLAWWLPQMSYGCAQVIGPEAFDSGGRGSGHYLRNMIQQRAMDHKVSLLPPKSPAELDELYASRTVTLLPSRYDTFNLAAAESLFSGCPTAVSTRAGICRFLQESFPDLPFVAIDIENLHAAVPQLVDVLTRYDEHRRELLSALRYLPTNPDGPPLPEIYRSPPVFDPADRREVARWYTRCMHLRRQHAHRPRLRLGRTTARLLSRYAPAYVPRALRSLHPRQAREHLKAAAVRWLSRNASLRHHAWLAHSLTQVRTWTEQYRKVMREDGIPESNVSVDEKLRAYGALISRIPLDRIHLWHHIANLELQRGNSLVGASYLLRSMRLAGADRFDDLPLVKEILTGAGFSQEAAVAESLYGQKPFGLDRCHDLLESALRNNREPTLEPPEFVDDRRDRRPYRVSIIVSMYEAADHLARFLHALSLQTLIQQGEAEVILVDSASPEDEYRIFRSLAEQIGIDGIYVRSKRRETIQTSWNRGICSAQGDYLCFLGVDEGLLPHALERLADELDRSPDVDWVQADSVVTRVDAAGTYRCDAMTYQRSRFQRPLLYLDTCYLSSVGALYRHSVHDRFGYYDGTFRAAGDTEFKNRIFPFIKAKTVPGLLGVFWDYPEQRTTCSPRAELEDLRAWYLHRSPAGVDYAFRHRDPEEAVQALYLALSYRKSFRAHQSSDIDYADSLCQFLVRHAPASRFEEFAQRAARLLEIYRRLDSLPALSANSIMRLLWRSIRQAAALAREQRRISGAQAEPAFYVFNDNRYEQHTNLWNTPPDTRTTTKRLRRAA